MFRYFLLLSVFVCFGLISTSSVIGQRPSEGITTVRGTISDENGELLIGASVVLADDKSKGTVTDLDGNYSLKIPGSGSRKVIITYIGYASVEGEIPLNPGAVVLKNFVLKSASVTIKEAVITAKAIKSSDSYMEKIKSKSAVSIDFISSATIKKTGDANVGAAVARIAGVSTNGNFISVRGIGDRYIRTSINGCLIPTLDPFTNNIKLDIFPSSMVDNIIVTKNTSPDLPGGWAGAMISIETRDFPEKFTANIETSFEYNTNSTFREYTTTEGSKTDWLGYDNSFREYDHEGFSNVMMSPSPYYQFVGLGLQPYFDSLGVNSGTAWDNTFYKLGLVRMGLLAPALFEDEEAFKAAKDAFQSLTYQIPAFNTLNQSAADAGKRFKNNYALVRKRAPLNFTQTISLGDQFTVFKIPVGLLVAMRYGRSVQNDNNASSLSIGTNAGTLIVNPEGQHEVSKETAGWNALINLSVMPGNHHKFTFLFLPNVLGSNNTRNTFQLDEFGELGRKQFQFYEHRQQLIYQLKTEHYIPSLKVKSGFNFSYTNGKSEAPDFKYFTYGLDDLNNGGIEYTHRYFRYLEEDIFDSDFHLEIPLNGQAGKVRKFKTGLSYQDTRKEFRQYSYRFSLGPGGNGMFTNDDPSQVFNPDDFELGTANINGLIVPTVKKFYEESKYPSNHTVGNSSISGVFAMCDYEFNAFNRVVAGVRAERFRVYTDAMKYDTLNLEPFDERRITKGDVYMINPGKSDNTNFLPSLGYIRKIGDERKQPWTIRLNYGKSVSRPSIRELYDGTMLDYELQAEVFGNSALKSCTADNYDVRFEGNFNENVSATLSLFYKLFNNHIELVRTNQGYSWQNVDLSEVRGIEIETKLKLFKNLDWFTNISLVNSKTEYIAYRIELQDNIKTYIAYDTNSRVMFGQAPYVVNSILSYTLDSLGITASLTYNVQGPRLVISSAIENVPEIYEMPRHLLDFKISKVIGKYFNLSLTIRDILNTSVRRAYKYNGAFDYKYDEYRWGTGIKLSLSYKL